MSFFYSMHHFILVGVIVCVQHFIVVHISLLLLLLFFGECVCVVVVVRICISRKSLGANNAHQQSSAFKRLQITMCEKRLNLSTSLFSTRFLYTSHNIFIIFTVRRSMFGTFTMFKMNNTRTKENQLTKKR